MTTDPWKHDPPIGACSDCGRRTWDPSMIGQTCYHPVFGGRRTCAGMIKPISKEAP